MGDVPLQPASIEGQSRRFKDKFGVVSHEIPRGLAWILAHPNLTTARHVGKILHNPIGGDDVGAWGHEAGIGIQLTQNMLIGVVGVEDPGPSA